MNIENGIKPYNQSTYKFGISNSNVHWNISSESLQDIIINKNMGIITDSGALAIDTGEFTGRSPKDRFIVKDDITEKSVWWGDINLPFSSENFDRLHKKVLDYLSNKEIFARNAFVCASDKHRLSLTVVNEYPWSNLFTDNMFIRPSLGQIQSFESEWLVLNAPGFHADPLIDGTRQHNFVALSFTKKIILIGGTGYTGEIKKGIFSALNFLLPYNHNVFSMHCSANVGEDGHTALFFGLSGTGKTTLSTDPSRQLIGDDEHGWSEKEVFNFEGGCYAKCINLSLEKEPDIFNAIRKGALLENITFKEGSNVPDYFSAKKSQNTRVSYPINHINNIRVPSSGPIPKNIFFLTCDAFGVLPPISRLTLGQTMYHFISGYTAKVAGTEADITEPQTTFSACFGAPFMPLHPTYYAEMLGRKITENKVNVWLINTGWSGGGYGFGSRIKLKYTRSIISAALNGSLDNVDYIKHSIFGLDMPVSCPDVPNKLLFPSQTWKDQNAYRDKAIDLAKAFKVNFIQFESDASEEVLKAAPGVEIFD
ncbi:MAG: phosphoenolpyruvate carboxykinase (ATP) [Flavobacteriales bacterium]|nr:phosphoenolpyruvate carboxykinase (ATP) [Flavobacteriales bacterium]